MVNLAENLLSAQVALAVCSRADSCHREVAYDEADYALTELEPGVKGLVNQKYSITALRLALLGSVASPNLPPQLRALSIEESRVAKFDFKVTTYQIKTLPSNESNSN